VTADPEHGGRHPDVSADSAAGEAFKRLTATSLPQGVESLARRIGVDQRDVERRKAFLELTDHDAALLTTLHARLAAHSSAFADRFYAHLSGFEETRSLLPDAATVERLKRSQAAYFDRLTAGNYAGDYVQDRIRVGETHHRIGLGPKWYLGAYSRYLCELMGAVWELAADDPQRAVDMARALVKVVFFDIGLTLDTYHQIDRWTIEELQAHAQRIVNNIPSGVLVLSADLRVLFANQAFIDLVGGTSERVIGMPLEAFFPTHRWWDRVARLLGIGESRSQMDVELVNAEGTRRIEMTLVPIARSVHDADHADQDRARLLLVLDDVTVQEQAEAALRESQRSLSTLIDNLPGAVYRCANDRDWSVQYMSPGITGITGFPADDFVQRRVTYGNLIHPDDQEQVWSSVQEAVAARRPFVLRYRIRTASGDERWVWEQGRGVYSDQGDLLALEGFIADTTERKWAEEAFGLIARDSSSLVGNQFFRSLTRNMAAALRVRRAFIAKPAGPDGSHCRVIAFWTGSDWAEPFEYPIEGTPCEQVVAGGFQYYPLNVQARFPEDVWLRDQGVASYMAVPLSDAAGHALGHMGVMHDGPMDASLPLESILRIFAARAGAELERQTAEEALRESEERYRNLVENAHDMIQSVDPNGRLLFVNRAWLDTMGYREQDISSLTLGQLLHPESAAHFRELFQRLTAGESPVLVEGIFVAKDGRSVPVEGSATGRYVDGRLVATHSIFRNVAERKEWEARLAHVTRHDHLTNLPNRAVFLDRLEQALVRIRTRRSERPLAVLILDLDRFKLVNETLGHAAGDRMLFAVAERLSGCLRDGDTVARLGGDEFAILLPEVARVGDTVIVADKIFSALKAPFIVDSHELFVSVSIGISVGPDDGDEAGQLLKNADAAMYRAKDQGRNTYQLYASAMNVSHLERLSLESNLRHALERDEFVVYYQPQVELRSGRVVGMEALVRWRHPEWGVVSPARFIPVAEETGLIVPIGERVLSFACAQNRRWQEQGIAPFQISVNLSARQFQQPELNAMVTRVLRESGLDPRWLDLELTESLLLSDAERTVAALNAFHAMGVGLALDDFGTGYSSLSYLKRYPIDTIKIDQSFVRHITTDADDAAISIAIIAMAHSLKLIVVAEGVETEEQKAFLAQQGCDVIQGYLLSRPLPADEITAWLNDRAARGGHGPARLPHAA
jgi:diguanylate cyclase (GGDEF)-like protein/PAS domain S-box-containing protein